VVTRRTFLGTLVSSLIAPPLALQAQSGKTARIGVLDPFSTDEGLPYRQAFFDALRELGYVEGRNVIVDVRTSDRDTTRVPMLVDELIALKPDVLVGNENAAVLMREKTTSTRSSGGRRLIRSGPDWLRACDGPG